MFQAITIRQSNRGEFDGKPLSTKEIQILEEAGKGDGVKLLFLTDHDRVRRALDYIILANTCELLGQSISFQRRLKPHLTHNLTYIAYQFNEIKCIAAQIDNPDFFKELKTWIRFGEADATTASDGLYSPCMGSPSIPRWLGTRIFDIILRSSSENAKILKQVQSSAGLAIFVSEKDDTLHWIEAGRCYERFALQATALGIRNSFLNMPVEEASIRKQFSRSFGIENGSRPDFVVRFGKGGNEMPRSLRRPVEEVLEYAK